MLNITTGSILLYTDSLLERQSFKLTIICRPFSLGDEEVFDRTDHFVYKTEVLTNYYDGWGVGRGDGRHGH